MRLPWYNAIGCNIQLEMHAKAWPFVAAGTGSTFRSNNLAESGDIAHYPAFGGWGYDTPTPQTKNSNGLIGWPKARGCFLRTESNYFLTWQVLHWPLDANEAPPSTWQWAQEVLFDSAT